jgi:prephenate dehydrogenase
MGSADQGRAIAQLIANGVTPDIMVRMIQQQDPRMFSQLATLSPETLLPAQEEAPEFWSQFKSLPKEKVDQWFADLFAAARAAVETESVKPS